MRRHNFRSMKPLSLETTRACHLNPTSVDNYFGVLEAARQLCTSVAHNNQEPVELSSSNVFNLDETGLHRGSVGEDELVVVPKDESRRRLRKTSSGATWHLTMTGVIFADGSALPPFFIMPGLRRYAKDSGRVEPQDPSRLIGTDQGRDRKSVAEGKRVSVRVDLGGGRILKKKKKNKYEKIDIITKIIKISKRKK